MTDAELRRLLGAIEVVPPPPPLPEPLDAMGDSDLRALLGAIQACAPPPECPVPPDNTASPTPIPHRDTGGERPPARFAGDRPNGAAAPLHESSQRRPRTLRAAGVAIVTVGVMASIVSQWWADPDMPAPAPHQRCADERCAHDANAEYRWSVLDSMRQRAATSPSVAVTTAPAHLEAVVRRLVRRYTAATGNSSDGRISNWALGVVQLLARELAPPELGRMVDRLDADGIATLRRELLDLLPPPFVELDASGVPVVVNRGWPLRLSAYAPTAQPHTEVPFQRLRLLGARPVGYPGVAQIAFAHRQHSNAALHVSVPEGLLWADVADPGAPRLLATIEGASTTAARNHDLQGQLYAVPIDGEPPGAESDLVGLGLLPHAVLSAIRAGRDHPELRTSVLDAIHQATRRFIAGRGP